MAQEEGNDANESDVDENLRELLALQREMSRALADLHREHRAVSQAVQRWTKKQEQLLGRLDASRGLQGGRPQSRPKPQHRLLSAEVGPELDVAVPALPDSRADSSRSRSARAVAVKSLGPAVVALGVSSSDPTQSGHGATWPRAASGTTSTGRVSKRAVQVPGGTATATATSATSQPANNPSASECPGSQSEWAARATMRYSRSQAAKKVRNAMRPSFKVPPIEDGYFPWVRVVAQSLVQWPGFDYAMGLVILANAIAIGIEIQMHLDGEETFSMSWVEDAFLVTYLVELAIRFLGEGSRALRRSWVVFDLCLVVLGVSTDWVVKPLIHDTEAEAAPVWTAFERSPVLRTLRLMRLARAMRLLGLSNNLWKLVQGLLHSGNTMVSTCAVILLTIYIFACIGIETITADNAFYEDPQVADIMRTNFASIPRLMLTLVQFTTMDSIASIYSPLIQIRPTLVLYFMFILLVISIVLMNMVTAVIVENALSSAQNDAEMESFQMRKRLQTLTPAIQAVFQQMDTSGDNVVEIREVIDFLDTGSVDVPAEIKHILQPDKLADLFEFLDLDGSGDLTEVEFVEGVCHLVMTSVPLETTQILQILRAQRRKMARIQQQLRSVPVKVSAQVLEHLGRSVDHDGLRTPRWQPDFPSGAAHRDSEGNDDEEGGGCIIESF